MILKRRKSLRVAGAAVLAASSMGVLALVASTGTVHADPAWEAASFGLASTRAGVGSDTIMNVYDYFSGADTYPATAAAGAPTPTFSTPVHSAADTGDVIVQSFDAFAPPSGTSAHPGCIVSKVNGPTFDRPNGSGAGINALNDANSGTAWEASAATTCTGKTVGITGQVDFARSSRGTLTAGTTDTWIPFARDAIAYAFFDGGTGSLSQLTSTQIQSLYQSSTGTITVAGHTVIACYVQPNSGTRIASELTYGLTDAQVTAAIGKTGCGVANAIAGSGLVEENNGNGFYNEVQALITAGSWPAGTWAVTPFSAGVWLAQANGGAPDFSNTLRGAEAGFGFDGLGEPDFGTSGQAPLGGVGPSPATSNNGAYTINNTYYHSTNAVVSGVPYGRYLYTVVPTANITPQPPFGLIADPALAELFVGTTSSLCTQDATSAVLNKFGFDAIPGAAGELSCGDTTTTGNS